MPLVKKVPKLWGEEFWIHNGEGYCMKILELVCGFQCSLHYHPVKAETFLVTKGTVEFELDGVVSLLYTGGSLDIPSGHPHRFRAITPRATVVEASTVHSDEDVVRLEESREL